MQSSLFDEASGRYLTFGSGKEAYRAFVPAPLPPKLALDVELVRVLSDADRALGELAGLGRNLSNPHLLIRPFVRREAVLSSRIEGTEATVAHVYAYEAEQASRSKAAPRGDAREVYNYVRALEYGVERLETLPVSLRMIRELHERLLEGVRGERDWPGQFREHQNWIGPPGCGKYEATYVPPPVPQMREALDAFEKYLHAEAEYPLLVRLALVHYQFEAIHPFRDGNGRIGRLLITLLLVRDDLLPLPLLYLSAYFERHRQQYYNLLLGISERGDWRGWLLFFLRGVAEQAADAVRRAKRLQDLQSRWRGELTEAKAPIGLLQVVDHLFEVPVLTIPQIANAVDVTYNTARSYVERLVQIGALEQMRAQSYSKTFYASDVLDAISDAQEAPSSEAPRTTHFPDADSSKK